MKLKLKAHTIKLVDECDHEMIEEQAEHHETEKEEDEYHPDIDSFINQRVYLHQWHRRVYELQQGITKARYRLQVQDDEMFVIDIDKVLKD